MLILLSAAKRKGSYVLPVWLLQQRRRNPLKKKECPLSLIRLIVTSKFEDFGVSPRIPKKPDQKIFPSPFYPNNFTSLVLFFVSKSLPRYITAFLSPQIPKEMFWLIPTIFISCQFSTEGAGIWDLAPGLMTLSRFSLRWPCGYYCHLYSLPDLVLF